MTTKKAAAKPAKSEQKPQSEKKDTQPTSDMEGVEYEAGYAGVSSDDEDYSIAAEVSRLSE